jgi:hypothetical protein
MWIAIGCADPGRNDPRAAPVLEVMRLLTAGEPNPREPPARQFCIVVRGGTKPTCIPIGVNGNSTAIATTASEVATSIGSARLFSGLQRTRLARYSIQGFIFNTAFSDEM